MPIIGAQTMINPNRPGHQSGVDSGNINPLYADQHFGRVERRFLDKAFMRKRLNVRTVRGTDTLTNPRMGIVPLQKLARGIRATDHSPTYDQVSIKVDTIILSRANEWTLEDFQSSYDTRMEIADEQGDEISKYFDECGIVQAIKGAQITAVHPDGSKDGGWEGQVPSNIERTAPEGHRGGTCVIFDAVDDELDPIAANLKIKRLMTEVRKKEVDAGSVIAIDWDFFETLSENDKLISEDYVKANGDYSAFTMYQSGGFELWPNNRMPQVAHTGVGEDNHFLSNASNNYSYNTSANDVKCVAVMFHPKGLLAGETIPLTTKIFWDDKDKQWYIDAWTAFAITPNRPEACAAIFLNSVA